MKPLLACSVCFSGTLPGVWPEEGWQEAQGNKAGELQRPVPGLVTAFLTPVTRQVQDLRLSGQNQTFWVTWSNCALGRIRAQRC